MYSMLNMESSDLKKGMNIPTFVFLPLSLIQAVDEAHLLLVRYT